MSHTQTNLNYTKQRQNIDNDMVAFDVEKAPQMMLTTGMLDHVPLVSPNPRPERPHFSRVYDTFKSLDALFFIEDFEINGTFTPTAGTTIKVPLTLAANLAPNFNLSIFPNATSLYLGVNAFSFANQTTPAVVGTLRCTYVDPTGYPIHLGVYQSSSINSRSIIKLFSRNPITDPSNPSMGELDVLLSPGGASAVVYDYSISFSVGYLLPSDGFEEKYEHRCMICDHEHHHQQEHSKTYENAA